jgi:hypothetical protein
MAQLEASTTKRASQWKVGAATDGPVVRALVPLTWDEKPSTHKKLQMERRLQEFRDDRGLNTRLPHDLLDRPFHFSYPVKEAVTAIETLKLGANGQVSKVGWGNHGRYLMQDHLSHVFVASSTSTSSTSSPSLFFFFFSFFLHSCFHFVPPTIVFSPLQQCFSHGGPHLWRHCPVWPHHVWCHPGIVRKLEAGDDLGSEGGPRVAQIQNAGIQAQGKRTHVGTAGHR